MKQITVKKYLKILSKAKKSNKSLKAYCEKTGISYNSIINFIYKVRQRNENQNADISKLLALYTEFTAKKVNQIDTDDKAEVSYIRNDEDKIEYYSYKIFKKNKRPLQGNLTREEMNVIHRLYSYYGDSLTQRIISRHFVDLSLIDFKRILKAFNITKASAPFAPHMFEECSEEELREIQLREKENSFLRKAEEDAIRNNEKLLKKYAQENIELKNQLSNLSKITVTIPKTVTPYIIKQEENNTGRNMNLYLSDMHIGAAINSGSYYYENINYGYDEVKRRLQTALDKLMSLGKIDTLNLVLLGDNIDCCGVYGKTARLDHDMPENMDVREQANSFIKIMVWFITSLLENKYCSTLNLYSVPTGNHGGEMEYVCNRALFSAINAIFPQVKTTLWEEFFGVFEQNNETFVCFHGKDAKFMRKGFPLNLDDKSKVMLYEWLHEKGIESDNVHFIKGDLHSDSLNSCKRLDYRNVLSLYGSSDYANFNFSRNNYGISYDLYIQDNLIRGTFVNL